ncbi:MAG: hypothetical protein LBL92_06950, partial [Propionibacteriaceae bacterium]|nr:hypothetical protein [Propionibacteriaceae bacterium]
MTDIATLPPPPEASQTGYPISPRTGQPQRPAWLVAVGVIFSGHIGLALWCYLSFWWTAASVTALPEANRLFAWLHPDPVSVLAVVLVVLTTLLAAAVVTFWGVLIYHAWHGHRWVRWGALLGLLTSAGWFFLHSPLRLGWFDFLRHPAAQISLAALTVILTAVAITWLWLGSFRRFSDAMTPPTRRSEERRV